ncbi:MAG TPA: HEAT repeat domain-containing protein [Haliangium sp.]|nr:HEAT repeat domain-containing protein [Haliangium sp.]
MTARRGQDFDLDHALVAPSFTPRRSDIPALLDRVASGADSAALAERALVRVRELAMAALVDRMPTGTPKATADGMADHAGGRAGADEPAARARLLRLAGKLSAHAAGDALIACLAAGLADRDERVRRAAATALGKVRDRDVGSVLAGALATETSASVQRALIEALGKAGGAHALAALDRLAPADAHGDEDADAPGPAHGTSHGIARAHERARLIADRTARRAEPSAIDGERLPTRPQRIAVRCRAGLERFVLDELGPAQPRPRHDGPGGARIELMLAEPLAWLFRSRTMLSFAFPLRELPVCAPGDADALATAVVTALASNEARDIFAAYTRGPVRYRLAWAAGGKRRALIFRIAAEVRERRPELVNDPTQSLWDVVVHEAPGKVRVELGPRVEDPRFAYRRTDVPAASHPTVAAALARAAGVQPHDVVWDPFVGSGLELCERSLLGPYRTLIGSDRDPAALAAASENLAAAGVPDDRRILVTGEAVSFSPPARPTLIVTNPPLGRRVERTRGLPLLLERFIEHAAQVLAPRGRLVWISPFPGRTLAVARRCGLTLTLAQDVDLGGFTAGLQAFRR